VVALLEVVHDLLDPFFALLNLDKGRVARAERDEWVETGGRAKMGGRNVGRENYMEKGRKGLYEGREDGWKNYMKEGRKKRLYEGRKEGKKDYMK
jgi:hypothetical protein